MSHGAGRFFITLVALALVATLGGYARPLVAQAASSPFRDIAGTSFKADIEWLFSEGITVGCSPTAYCPSRPVSRGEMASFLVRMFDLPPTTTEYFTDDDGTTHEQDINRLAAADVTTGCTDTTFCPKVAVRRDEMASFLTRAVPFTDGAGDNYFRDDDGTTHEADIDRAAAAGVTTGCGTWRYCIADPVTRGQMAGFLHRVEKPVASPPHPAPGIATLYVATTGTDAGNACLVEATPCRTIGYAVGITLDGDRIAVAGGTYAEENLRLAHDLTISGDPDGSTVIDASGGEPLNIFTIPTGRVVSLRDLTLTGGDAVNDGGGAISNEGTLTVANSTISGNTAQGRGGAIDSSGPLTITNSTLRGNTATNGARAPIGGAISELGPLTITNSTFSGNTAISQGGAIVICGPLTIANSTISGNAAYAGAGGGIGSCGEASADEDTWTVTNTTISGNTGGGIWGSGTLTITNSTISGNTGGDIWGGGIVTTGPSTTVANSTISGNTSSHGAGGIDTWSPGTMTITNSTISGNSSVEGAGGIMNGREGSEKAKQIHLENTIVAGNAHPGSPETTGPIESRLASILGIPIGLTLADILDPAGLKDNGGPTKSIALTDSAKNPALGKADAAICGAAPVYGLDQRGLPRTPPCDIGAYEIQASDGSDASAAAEPSSEAGATLSPQPTVATELALTIDSPKPGTVVHTSPIEVVGHAPAGARVVHDIWMAPDEEAIATSDGHWSLSVALVEGANELVFRLGDDASTDVHLGVAYAPSAGSTSTTTPTPTAQPTPTPQPSPSPESSPRPEPSPPPEPARTPIPTRASVPTQIPPSGLEPSPPGRSSR